MQTIPNMTTSGLYNPSHLVALLSLQFTTLRLELMDDSPGLYSFRSRRSRPPRPPHVVGSLPLVDLANCPATGEGSSQNTNNHRPLAWFVGIQNVCSACTWHHMMNKDSVWTCLDIISFYPALCTSAAQVLWTQYTSALEFQATIQGVNRQWEVQYLNDIRGALNHGVIRT